jgi:hypothetical protein
VTVSDSFKADVFAQETGEAFIILLAIDHDDLSSPIYLGSDGVDTISNSKTYIAYPFDFIAPAMAGDKEPAAKIEIDNVSREIIEAIRGLSSPPTIEVDIVRASVPDTIEVSFPDFLLNDVTYDRLVVSGTMVVETLGNEPFPAHSFLPSNFPGLFGGVV